MENKIYSVTEVNKYIKMVLDNSTFLHNISIRGEITNFKAHYTGHLYFTLKDENSSIKCVMFKSYAESVKFEINDGMKVVIDGQVSVYEANGTYQIYCKKVMPEGLGELYVAYEQLKERLSKEGLFDEIYKKKIPYIPKRVGIITSKTGAVIRDIINVTSRRYEKIDLLIYPAQVQGIKVAETVISGIRTFNKLNNVDVIIIARGGGSFEDLFGFNDENLARCIFESRIPIISAVGHETDFTICDFVSDLRAPTPSAAAELVYPQMLDLRNKLEDYRYKLNSSIYNYLLRKKEYVKRIKASKLEKVPLDLINSNRIKIDNILKLSENKLRFKMQNDKSKFAQIISKIDALSPLKTLSRGFSVCQNLSGIVITKVSDVNNGENLKVTLSDGKIDVTVL